MFGLKHGNRGTLDSLNIFLRSICADLNPEIIINMDIGQEAMPNSIYNLINHYDNTPDSGGCNGEIGAYWR